MNDDIMTADQSIGHMYAITDEVKVIVNLLRNNYFFNRKPKEEDLLRIRTEWNTIATLLDAATELLRIAEDENNKWQMCFANQTDEEMKQ